MPVIYSDFGIASVSVSGGNGVGVSISEDGKSIVFNTDDVIGWDRGNDEDPVVAEKNIVNAFEVLNATVQVLSSTVKTGEGTPDETIAKGESVTIPIKVLNMPWMLAQFTRPFIEYSHMTHLDEVINVPPCAWSPYTYNGTHGAVYARKRAHLEDQATAVKFIDVVNQEGDYTNRRYLRGAWDTVGYALFVGLAGESRNGNEPYFKKLLPSIQLLKNKGMQLANSQEALLNKTTPSESATSRFYWIEDELNVNSFDPTLNWTMSGGDGQPITWTAYSENWKNGDVVTLTQAGTGSTRWTGVHQWETMSGTTDITKTFYSQDRRDIYPAKEIGTGHQTSDFVFTNEYAFFIREEIHKAVVEGDLIDITVKVYKMATNDTSFIYLYTNGVWDTLEHLIANLQNSSTVDGKLTTMPLEGECVVYSPCGAENSDIFESETKAQHVPMSNGYALDVLGVPRTPSAHNFLKGKKIKLKAGSTIGGFNRPVVNNSASSVYRPHVGEEHMENSMEISYSNFPNAFISLSSDIEFELVVDDSSLDYLCFEANNKNVELDFSIPSFLDSEGRWPVYTESWYIANNPETGVGITISVINSSADIAGTIDWGFAACRLIVATAAGMRKVDPTQVVFATSANLFTSSDVNMKINRNTVYDGPWGANTSTETYNTDFHNYGSEFIDSAEFYPIQQPNGNIVLERNPPLGTFSFSHRSHHYFSGLEYGILDSEGNWVSSIHGDPIWEMQCSYNYDTGEGVIRCSSSILQPPEYLLHEAEPLPDPWVVDKFGSIEDFAKEVKKRRDWLTTTPFISNYGSSFQAVCQYSSPPPYANGVSTLDQLMGNSFSEKIKGGPVLSGYPKIMPEAIKVYGAGPDHDYHIGLAPSEYTTAWNSGTYDWMKSNDYNIGTSSYKLEISE